MKYTVEMSSSAMTYIPSFHKDWFRHSKADNGEVHRQHGDLIGLLLFYFLKIKENRLKIMLRSLRYVNLQIFLLFFLLCAYYASTRGAGIAQSVQRRTIGWTAEDSRFDSRSRQKDFSPDRPNRLWGSGLFLRR
jgi:hypothetical protein